MCNDYRSWNMFMGMPSTGYKGQMTLRGEKNETGEAYAKRIMDEIGIWYGLGWQVERAYFDDGTRLGTAADPECRIDSLAQS